MPVVAVKASIGSTAGRGTIEYGMKKSIKEQENDCHEQDHSF